MNPRRAPTFPELAKALAVADQPRYVIAAQARIPGTTLSSIIHGRYVPSPAQRARLSRVLKVDEDELFRTAVPA